MPARTDAPRRVLLVEQNWDGTAGGSFQSLYDIARCLDRERYTPIVLFQQQNRFVEPLAALGVPIHIWTRAAAPPNGGRKLPGQRYLNAAAGILRRARFLREQHIDVVHLNNAPSVGADDWLPAAHLLGRPCITHARLAAKPTRNPVHRWLQRRFDLVLADSRHIAETVVATGIPRDRVRVVYEGVDAEEFRRSIHQPREAMRKSCGAGPDTMVVVMVGHLRPWKGQHVLVEALALLTTERERLKVIFVGGTPAGEENYAAALARRVAEAGLGSIVSFVGERHDVADYMEAADIVVHASTIPEPFGIVVVEGMSLGKTVMASALGGPLEIIVPGSGLLFDPSKPAELTQLIARATADPALRASLGAGAIVRADAFSVRALLHGTESAYDEALALHTGRRSQPGAGSPGGGVASGGVASGGVASAGAA
jgi:glycosyltransferase involved in cell wall biosynthesis